MKKISASSEDDATIVQTVNPAKRFLLDHGSNVAAVNNDGELAIDISESDEMEELLQKEIDAQKVWTKCKIT